jgi:opacity protein-like surface antigen
MRRTAACASDRGKDLAMVSVTLLIRAAAATMVSSTAFAADMAAPLPPPVYQPPPTMYQPQPTIMEAPAISGGWYLRGDVGIGMLNFSEFDHTQTNSSFGWPPSWTIVQSDIQDTSILGAGAGYEVNNFLRVDVTGEYRTKAMFKVTGSYTDFCAGGGICFDVNSANYSAAVFMANVYLDLGTWWCLTPYIGAGVGGAYNAITGIQDNGINSDGFVGFGYSSGDNSAWGLAWNVQAGLTYNVSNTFKVDFNWRYLNMGSPVSAVVNCQNTSPCPGAYYTLKDMGSQDFRIGFRWLLQPDVPAVMMPQPAPPLMSRG